MARRYKTVVSRFVGDTREVLGGLGNELEGKRVAEVDIGGQVMRGLKSLFSFY